MCMKNLNKKNYCSPTVGISMFIISTSCIQTLRPSNLRMCVYDGKLKLKKYISYVTYQFAKVFLPANLCRILVHVRYKLAFACPFCILKKYLSRANTVIYYGMNQTN